MEVPMAAYPPTSYLLEKEALGVVFPRPVWTYWKLQQFVLSVVADFYIEMGKIPCQEKAPWFLRETGRDTQHDSTSLVCHS